jgi:hypothetical protein
MPEDPIEVEVLESPDIDLGIENTTQVQVELIHSAPIEVVVESPNEPDQLIEVSNPPEILVEILPEENMEVVVETPPDILVEIMENGEASGVSSWVTLSQTWTQAPILVTAIPGGDVYLYTYGSTSFYRFVPNPYDSMLDQFFSAFSNPNLTGLLATRGTPI